MKRKRNFKEEFIGDRRFELFKRDPLTIEMESFFRKSLLDNLSQTEKETLSSHVEKLWKELMKKWNCYLIRNWGWKEIPDIIKPTGYLNFIRNWDGQSEPFACYTFSSGAFTVVDAREYIKEFLEKLWPEELEEVETKGWTFRYLDGGYDDRGNVYIPIPPGSIPLIIDAGGLTEKDKNKVTEEIWNIIKPEIKERRGKAKGQRSIPAVRDSKELGFITTLSDGDFAKYLKWYDLHTQGYTFRKIAYYEYLEKNHPDIAEEAKRKIENRTKTIKSRIGKERTIKGFIGEPIKGEDNVEKGVKLIYQAIHRKPYPSKEKQTPFNCPEHGNEYNEDCQHCKKWFKKFNTSKKLFNPLNTLSPEALEQVVDDYYNPKKTKKKKLD